MHTRISPNTHIHPSGEPPNTAPSSPAPLRTGQNSHSKKNIHHSPMSNSHTSTNSCGECTTPASYHTAPRCPMRGQFTSNGHIASKCPTMSGLRQDRHNRALQLLLSLMERHNVGRWETITANFGSKPIKHSHPSHASIPPLNVTPLTPPTCPPVWLLLTKASRPTPSPHALPSYMPSYSPPR
jgi:hypothetical protein